MKQFEETEISFRFSFWQEKKKNEEKRGIEEGEERQRTGVTVVTSHW